MTRSPCAGAVLCLAVCLSSGQAAAASIYWSDYAGPEPGNRIGDIRRANLDGTGQSVLITGLPYPIGLTLDVPEPSAVLLLGLCALAMLRRHEA